VDPTGDVVQASGVKIVPVSNQKTHLDETCASRANHASGRSQNSMPSSGQPDAGDMSTCRAPQGFGSPLRARCDNGQHTTTAVINRYETHGIFYRLGRFTVFACLGLSVAHARRLSSTATDVGS
jgi:hypothetical protein